ncbi:MAG: tetraacyldisaccharide 4'-kinase [Desulfatitalea sp.]|nr:tetraacyldisaccharide 4'-kinase [Desulfatitalea sp.]NNK00894.1 tetraacyldisaccharide 4'-kinase [Desulfatitalea sp.]
MIPLLRTLERRVRLILEDSDQGRWPALKTFLQGVSMAYGLPVVLRSRLYATGLMPCQRLPCKTIVIGNLTAGGTGKTPMTVYMAQLAQRLGYRPAILSRGYKGRAETHGGVVADGRRVLMNADMAGDEPLMMALSLGNIPVLVGRARYKSGMQAIRDFDIDVVICDDAYQHLTLHRDLNLLLLDCAQPFGNGRLLPRGSLREPRGAHRRAHALIMTRCEPGRCCPGASDPRAFAGGRPLFFTRHVPFVSRVVGPNAGQISDIKTLKGLCAYAFSGIARNRDFRRGLIDAGCRIVGHAQFPDHHGYSESDLAQICKSAMNAGAKALITTEKDEVRLARRPLPLDLVVMGIRIDFGADSPVFEAYIAEQLHRTQDWGRGSDRK